NLGIPLAPLRRARRKESVDTEWARIGVVTKKLWSKESQWHNHSARNGPPTSRRCWRRLRAPMATGPVALEPPSSTLPSPTDLNPGAALSWPENRVFRRRFVEATQTSSSKFSFVSPPNRSSKAPGARQNYKRDLRGIEVARTICHRNMRDPPPSHSNPPHHHVRGDSAEISAEV
ncbi:hypothetical protein Prudu_218S000500, partial [Prunus dulcis]